MSEVKVTAQTSRLALTALALGIITHIALIVIGLLLTATFSGSDEFNTLISVAILAIPLPDVATLVLSLVSWRRIAKSDGRLKGRGFSIGGLIVGIVVAALLAVILIAVSQHGPVSCSPPTLGRPPC